jgi:hypothetical protein
MMRSHMEQTMSCGCTLGSRRRSLLIVALAAVLVFESTSSVWAWGRLGHRLISRLAEQRLTPKARGAIAELLEPGESLADA